MENYTGTSSAFEQEYKKIVDSRKFVEYQKKDYGSFTYVEH